MKVVCIKQIVVCVKQNAENRRFCAPSSSTFTFKALKIVGLNAFACKRWLHGLGFEPRQTCAYENLSLTPWTSRAPVRSLLSRGQVVYQRQAIRPVFPLKFLAMFKCEFLRIHD